jgi:hypothetical protein
MVCIAAVCPPAFAQTMSAVTFDRPVHFEAADGKVLRLAPGSYRFEPAEAQTIRLVRADGATEAALKTVETSHDRNIDDPVSMVLSDPRQPDVLHLVVLLPGGKGLDAIGSYSGVMTRGAAPITNAQIAQSAVAQLAIAPVPLFVLIPPHGPSGTPVRVEICGLSNADFGKFGTVGVGNKVMLQTRGNASCSATYNGIVYIGEEIVFDMQGPPGPVPIRVEIPGASRPAEVVNFVIDPGPPIVWNPRFQTVLGGAAVLDKETLLVWERLMSARSGGNLDAATSRCRSATIGGRLGWRLPTAAEFGTLIEPLNDNPSLPTGHPFIPMNGYPTVWTSDQRTDHDPSNYAVKEYTYGVSATFRRISIDPVFFRQEMLDRTPLVPGLDFKSSFSEPNRMSWCVRGPGVPLQ